MHHESVTAGLLVEHIMNKSPGTSEDDALERVVSFKKRVRSKLESDIEKIGGCQGRRVQSMLALFEKLSDIRFGPVIAEIAKRHGLGLRK